MSGGSLVSLNYIRRQNVNLMTKIPSFIRLVTFDLGYGARFDLYNSFMVKFNAWGEILFNITIE